MNKKLPRVFRNTIDKEIKNNREVYYVNSSDDDFSFVKEKKDIIKEDIDINEKIRRIFKPGRHIFAISVIIVTKDKTYDTKIAGKVKDNIITLDNDVININSILDIYEKK